MTFDTFWVKYPRKVGKRAAQKSYDALIKQGVDPARIEAELSKLVNEIVDKKTAAQYIPHASTWLNREDFTEVCQTAPETLPFDKAKYIQKLREGELPPVPKRSEAEKARARELMAKFKRGIKVGAT